MGAARSEMCAPAPSMSPPQQGSLQRSRSRPKSGTRKSTGYVGCVPSSSTPCWPPFLGQRSEEHTSELQSQSNLVCRLLLEKKKKKEKIKNNTLLYHSKALHLNIIFAYCRFTR